MTEQKEFWGGVGPKSSSGIRFPGRVPGAGTSDL